MLKNMQKNLMESHQNDLFRWVLSYQQRLRHVAFRNRLGKEPVVATGDNTLGRGQNH